MRYKNTYKVSVYKEDEYASRCVKGPRRPDFPLAKINPDFTNLDDSKCFYSFLGHSSIFLKLNQYNILIDPVFCKKIGPFKIIGCKRFLGPVVKDDKFPNIDIICITHNHFDHLDVETLKEFDHKTKLYIVPKDVKKVLTFHGINENKVIELSWNETYTYKDIVINCLESHHNSMRYFYDKDASLWCSYAIKYKDISIFHSGDSAFSKHYEDIHSKFNHFDLVFIECGQYNIHWHHMHMFPEESVEASKILNGKLCIPIHWGAYCISKHAWNESIIRYEKRAKELNIPYLIPELYKVYPIK